MLTQINSGTDSHRVDVDFEYGCFDGVFIAYDAVEGEHYLLLEISMNEIFTNMINQSKLQLPDDASLDDSEARAQLRLGLFSYPVLQAADILVHRYVSAMNLRLYCGKLG